MAMDVSTPPCDWQLRRVPHGNRRDCQPSADYFEREIQRVIEGSQWNPRDDIRRLRGRTLRFAEKNVTDIDAIGERNGALLVIFGEEQGI
jgi:hypothetical protein